MSQPLPSCFFFFFNDTATTEIYTLSLHDALPIFLIRPFFLATRNASVGDKIEVIASLEVAGNSSADKHIGRGTWESFGFLLAPARRSRRCLRYQRCPVRPRLKRRIFPEPIGQPNTMPKFNLSAAATCRLRRPARLPMKRTWRV